MYYIHGVPEDIQIQKLVMWAGTVWCVGDNYLTFPVITERRRGEVWLDIPDFWLKRKHGAH